MPGTIDARQRLLATSDHLIAELERDFGRRPLGERDPMNVDWRRARMVAHARLAMIARRLIDPESAERHAREVRALYEGIEKTGLKLDVREQALVEAVRGPQLP